MTGAAMRDPEPRWDGSRPPPAALRWLAAACVVAAAHGALAWLALNWHPAAAAPEGPPPAVMIDLAPIAAAPEQPARDVAQAPQFVEERSETTDEPVAHESEEEPPPAPRDEPEPKPSSTPLAPQFATAVAPPSPAQLPASEAVPAQHRRETHRPETRPVNRRPAEAGRIAKAREATHDRPVERVGAKARPATAPPASSGSQAKTAAAPAAGVASTPSVSPASWKAELMAQLNRHKRFPPGAGAGTVSVIFTISRVGEVLSTHLATSSGDTALDAEAVSLPRRSSPLPPPPQGIGAGGSVTIAVPIRFNR